MTAKLTAQQIRDMQARMGDNSQQHYALGCMDESLIGRLDFALRLTRDVQERLDDKDRLYLWQAIQEGYCEFCGTRLKPKETCYCTNDE